MIKLYANIQLPDGVTINGSSVIVVDNHNSTSISDDIKDRAETSQPSYGLISNTGSLKFRMDEDVMEQIITSGATKSRLKCNIYLENTLSNKQKLISEKYTGEWDYDNNTRVAEVTIADDLVDLQYTFVDKTDIIVGYPAVYTKSHPFWHYFFPVDRWSSGGVEIAAPISWELNIIGKDVKFTEKAKEMLTRSTAEWYYINSGNSWAYYNDLAQALQMHIYVDQNTIIVDYQGGE